MSDLGSIGVITTGGGQPFPEAGTSGTVLSVALSAPSIFTVSGSPITTSGTLVITLATENANSVFAGPTTGAAATPTFRPLAFADIPGLTYVTSVGLSAPSSIFGVTGSPVGSSGVLTFYLNTETANTFFSGPTTGAAAVPTFRTLAYADIPGLTYVTSVGLSAPSSVFGVTGSPVGSSGVLTFYLNTETANTVWAGPTTGAAATPTFRTLAYADIPGLTYVTSVGLSAPASIFGVTGSPVGSSGVLTFYLSGQQANKVFAGPTSGATTAPTFRSLVLADIPGLTYVVSVGLSAPASIFGVTGSPVGSSGVLTFYLTGQQSNFVFAGPASGATAVPTFRALGSSDMPLFSGGVLPPANGGTGATAFTTGSIVFVDGSGMYAQDNANFFYGSSTIIFRNSNFGLGVTSPTALLHTSGTIRFQGLGIGAGTFSSTLGAFTSSILGITLGGQGSTSITGAQTNLGLLIGTDVQAWDADLDAIAALSATGMITRTANGAAAVRTITGTANQITVTNGSGAAGNPTLSLPADVIIPTILTVPNDGLHILDTNSTHDLIVTPGSNLTADRIFTLTTGDAARFLDISAVGVTIPLFGASLIAAITPAAARTVLGLGTAAVKDTGTSGDAVGLLSTSNTWSLQQIFTGQVPCRLEYVEAGAAIGPRYTLFRDSASPAASDLLGGFIFAGNNSTPAEYNYAQMNARIVATTAGSEDGRIDFFTSVVGTLSLRGYAQNGLVWGVPTGADQGTGTINCKAAYDDGVLLTCPALQPEFLKDRIIDLEKWDAKVPDTVDENGKVIEVRIHKAARILQSLVDSGFDPRDVDQYLGKMELDHALPGMPTESDWVHNSQSLGDMTSRKWLAMELMALAMRDMRNKQLKLEARIAALEGV